MNDDGQRGGDDDDGSSSSSSSSSPGTSGDISSPWPPSASSSSSSSSSVGDDGDVDSSVAGSSSPYSSDDDDDDASPGSSVSGSSGSGSPSSSPSHHRDGDDHLHDDRSDRGGGEGEDDDDDSRRGNAVESPSRSDKCGGSGRGSGSGLLVGLVETATSSSSSPLFDDYGASASGGGGGGGGGGENYDRDEEELVAAVGTCSGGRGTNGRDGDHCFGGGTDNGGGGDRRPSPFSELERRGELTRRRGAGRRSSRRGGVLDVISTGAAPPSPVRRRRGGGRGGRSGRRRGVGSRRYYHHGNEDDDDFLCSNYAPAALKCLLRRLPPCPGFCTSNMCLLAASAIWFVAQVRFHSYMFPSTPTSTPTTGSDPDNDRGDLRQYLSRRRAGTDDHKSVHTPPEHLTKGQAETLRRQRREEAENALGSAAATGNEAFLGVKKPPKNVRKSRKGRKEAGVEKLDSEDCEYAEWQTYDFPVCNSLHEIDLTTALGMRRGMGKLPGEMGVGGDFANDAEDAAAEAAAAEGGHKLKRAKAFLVVDSGHGDDDGMGYLGSGLWRNVWRIPDSDFAPEGGGGGGGGGVLKMMKMDHPVDERNFDRHRRDALAMERLTSDPHVTTPFGYCGNTVFADCVGCSSRTNPRGLDEVLFLDSPERKRMDRLRREEGGATRSTEVGRLRLALDVARGLRALHAGVPGGGPPIAHADIQAKQFLLDERGRVVINDFNRCRFVARKKARGTDDKNGNATDASVAEEEAAGGASSSPPEYCPFRIATAPGTSRSPEEYKSTDLTEKIDVFSVGHVLYGILTGRKSFANSKKGNPLETKKKIKRGETPKIDEARDVGGRRGDAVLAGLVERTFTMDPMERISASQLVDELERALASFLILEEKKDENKAGGRLREDPSQQNSSLRR